LYNSLFLKYISSSVLLYSIHYIFHSIKYSINRQLILLYSGIMLGIFPMKTEMLNIIKILIILYPHQYLNLIIIFLFVQIHQYTVNVDHHTLDLKLIIHINCNTSEIDFSIVLSGKKRESMQTISKMIYASKIT
jgi:hypothetical protein